MWNKNAWSRSNLKDPDNIDDNAVSALCLFLQRDRWVVYICANMEQAHMMCTL